MTHNQTMRKQAGQTAFFGQKNNFLNNKRPIFLTNVQDRRSQHVRSKWPPMYLSHIGHNRREKGGFSQTYLNSTYYITRRFADLGV